MSNETLTFSELRDRLAQLGFAETDVPGSHVAFEHAPSGALLVLRPHRPKDKLAPAVVAVVRRTLVENGLLSGAAFERWLHGANSSRASGTPDSGKSGGNHTKRPAARPRPGSAEDARTT
jgi:predicted RNA binding protein YcfA (HicA-like mRNA interferase family)